MSAVLVEVGSFMGVSRVSCLFYYLLCERVLFGELPLVILNDLLRNFKYTFHAILHGTNVFTITVTSSFHI